MEDRMRTGGSPFVTGSWRRGTRRRSDAGPVRRALARIVTGLPKGQLLPDGAWEQRHRWLVVVVALHAVGLGVFGIGRGYGVFHSLLLPSLVAGAAAFAAWSRLPRGMRSVAASVGLVTSSALLVHFWDGQIEAHFHFFFVVAMLTLYQDWLPFLLAIAYVVLHHGALGALDPGSVYNHPGGAAHPWRWALVHAVFVLAASAASVVAWRVNEQLLREPLTGLPGREVFFHAVRRALGRATPRKQLTAVLFLDLDRFKVLNDSLGHAAGDRLLVEVSQRITEAVREGDVVARLGGDEFAVLCEGLTAESQAVAVGERIRDALARPFLLDGVTVVPGASIGVAIGRESASASEELIADADLAMYRAKGRRSGSVVLLGEEMRKRELQRLETETALRAALEREEFRLVYQPIVSLADGRVVGAEALLRWEHPERGTVPPGEFIPVAEQSGLILPIGQWVLREACLEASTWPGDEAGSRPYVSVNVSPRQFADPELLPTVVAALESSGLPAERLALEITETAVLENEDSPVETLQALKQLGVRVMLDDFGTGYSSLSSVERLPIETLKIDRSFIAALEADAGKAPVIAAITGMAKALGIGVIAEGVEEETQVRSLRLLGLGFAQGYHFGRPWPAERLRAHLSAGPAGAESGTASVGS
jgi:diguanylate cyclase (GGDEF)-like protein